MTVCSNCDNDVAAAGYKWCTDCLEAEGTDDTHREWCRGCEDCIDVTGLRF